MGLRVLAAAAALLLVTSAADARTASWFPHRKGECGWVHGRYLVANGSRIQRIWVIGTHHVLNLQDDEIVPQELDVGFDKWLYGDFFVCAVETFKPGNMQAAQFRRVKNLVSEPYGYSR